MLIVYIDIIFVLNAIINMFILYIVSFVFRLKTSVIRILISASTGALIYCLCISVSFVSADNFVIGLIILLIMSQIAFNPDNLKSILRVNLFVMVIAVMLGGICFYIFNVLNIKYFSTYIILLSISLFYLIVKSGIKYFDQSIAKRNCYKKLNVIVGNNTYTLTALIDTGFVNCKNNIIIAEKSIFVDLSDENNCIPINFKSLGNENTTIKALKGKCIIENQLNEILIGLYEGKLSGGEFNAIISSEFLGGDKFDYA